MSVKGSEEYEGMPRNERSRISGWDSRKAAKSVSSLTKLIWLLLAGTDKARLT